MQENLKYSLTISKKYESRFSFGFDKFIQTRNTILVNILHKPCGPLLLF